MLNMKAATPILFAMLLSAASVADVPKAPTELCVDNNCLASPEPSTNGIKWHPGHYMLVFRGDRHDTVMSQRIPEICAEPALKGLQFRANGSTWRPAKGSTIFVRSTICTRRSPKCGKRLVVEVWAVELQHDEHSGIVPSYILSGHRIQWRRCQDEDWLHRTPLGSPGHGSPDRLCTARWPTDMTTDRISRPSCLPRPRPAEWRTGIRRPHGSRNSSVQSLR